MKSCRTGEEIVVDDVELDCTFENGFILNWDSNIGFGQLTFIDDNGELKVQTETMCNNEDKEFIHLVLNKFIEKLKVIE